MKTTLLMATVLVLAACGGGQQGGTPAADTSASAPVETPAPTMQDTSMTSDSGMQHSDSSMARDSAAHY